MKYRFICLGIKLHVVSLAHDIAQSGWKMSFILELLYNRKHKNNHKK
jgi:hypothetical protein